MLVLIKSHLLSSSSTIIISSIITWCDWTTVVLVLIEGRAADRRLGQDVAGQSTAAAADDDCHRVLSTGTASDRRLAAVTRRSEISGGVAAD